jgi:hypothetical protein
MFATLLVTIPMLLASVAADATVLTGEEKSDRFFFFFFFFFFCFDTCIQMRLSRKPKPAIGSSNSMRRGVSLFIISLTSFSEFLLFFFFSVA